MFEILKDKDLEPLSEGVFRVLEKLGMICENKEMLKAVENIGAEVDYEKQNAKFPKRIVENFISTVKKEDKAKWEEEIKEENKKTVLSGWTPYVECPATFKAPYVPSLFHQLGTFYYDDEKKERRKGCKDDFIKLIKFGDVLHPEDGVGHCLNLSDVSSAIEPLEAAGLLIEYAHKPMGVYVQDMRQLDYLKEIEQIAALKDPYWHWLANISFATPLKLGKEISDRFVYLSKSCNYPAKVYTMAVSGVNMPVTTAGCIVVTTAEFIALWMCARALNPKIPLTGFILTGSMDMRSGEVNYWGYDMLIRRLSTCEFIRKLTGVAVSPGIGEFCQAKYPGLYATLEKAYLAMTVAAFTGFHPEVGIGHIEQGLTISLAQLLLDREINMGLRFLESPVIDEENIALETILDVGYGISRNYLDTEHTLRNFRSALWKPEFFDLSGRGIESEEKLMKKINEKINQLISEYKKPEVDPDKISKIRQVIEKARRNLI